jgi:hypothetical protein
VCCTQQVAASCDAVGASPCCLHQQHAWPHTHTPWRLQVRCRRRCRIVRVTPACWCCLRTSPAAGGRQWRLRSCWVRCCRCRGARGGGAGGCCSRHRVATRMRVGAGHSCDTGRLPAATSGGDWGRVPRSAARTHTQRCVLQDPSSAVARACQWRAAALSSLCADSITVVAAALQQRGVPAGPAAEQHTWQFRQLARNLTGGLACACQPLPVPAHTAAQQHRRTHAPARRQNAWYQHGCGSGGAGARRRRRRRQQRGSAQHGDAAGQQGSSSTRGSGSGSGHKHQQRKSSSSSSWGACCKEDKCGAPTVGSCS